MGVKQGEPLLPFWFLLYINGIQECLLSNYIDSFTIREKQLSYVVIPDIFFDSKERFTDTVNKLHKNSKQSIIIGNDNKTAVTVLKSTGL